MDKDNLVLITMVVFFAVMLVIALRAVLASEPVRYDNTRGDTAADDTTATIGQGHTGGTPMAAQTTQEETNIWTADDTEMLRPVSYPVPPIPDLAPTAPLERVERGADSDEGGYSGNNTYAVSVGPFIY